VCDGGSATPTQTFVVVADLDDVDASQSSARLWTLQLTVPDTSQPNKTFKFSVTGRQQITPATP
jgi:hypothetical protein